MAETPGTPALPALGAEGARTFVGATGTRLTLWLSLFVALYVGSGLLGLRLVAVSGFATPVWAPSGLALVALLGFGHHVWPAIAVGALLVNLGAGAPVGVALGIAFGNTLEGLVGSTLLRRYGFVPGLQRIRDVFLLVLLAAGVSTLVSPTLGVTSLWLGGQAPAEALAFTWLTWWIGDALGDLVVAPLLLVWLAALRPVLDARRLAEAGALLLALGLANAIVFSNLLVSEGGAVVRQAYIVFPILIWAAIRFRQHGTVLATFFTACSAITATSLGFGPFAGASLSASLLLLQVFMGVVAVTMLTLASAVNERDMALQERVRILAAETEARRRAEAAEIRARFLDESGRVLSSSLNYRETLQQIAELAVPGFADWCSVEILESDGGVAQAALVHREAAKVETGRAFRQSLAPQSSVERGLSLLVQSGRAELFPEITDELLRELSSDKQQYALLRKLELTSAIIVPLFTRERLLGAMGWATAESRRRYGEADLALAQDLARRAAVAIDNSRLYEQAQNAISAREQFLSIASHELRTPLAALTLQVQSLTRSQSQTDGPLTAKLQLVDRQVGRLTALVDNLLDVSRIVSGKLALELEPLDLRPVLDEVIERFSQQIERSGSSLTLELADSCVGCWDRFRLEQIVTNLLANALKYGRGSPIVLRLVDEPDRAVFSFKDGGIGIALEDQQRIFDRFERAVSHRNFGGLGLGLWITRQLVAALGGTIAVSSELGRGAEFSVTLPKAVNA